MDIFKLVGKLVIDNNGFSAGLDDATGKARNAEGIIGKAFKAVGTAIATYLTIDAIKDFGQACVQAAADAQAMEAQFTQVFGDFEGNARTSLESIATTAGMTENRMKGSFTKIAAFAKTTGLDTESALSLSERALIAAADSAAFYDRTLEEATESLQSFLKGNFENDAALGLSCTEITRNAAATELWGKEFNKLSEAQKQLTLLKMVEDANALSGAMGQASRESETWTNQTGNLKQAWTDFQAEIGEHVLPAVVDIVGSLGEFVQTATEKVDPAVQTITEKFQSLKEWLSDLGTYASGTLQPVISDLSAAFTKVKDAVQPLIDKLVEYVSSGQAAEDATNLLKDAIEFAASAYQSMKDFVNDAIVAYQDACTWVEEHALGLEILAAAIGVVATALGAYTIAQAIASAGGVAAIASNAALAVGYYALVAAETVATTATAAFGAVMAVVTSPITLVVAAIAAVIAIIVLCVKHWDEIKAKTAEVAAFIAAKWEEIKAAVAEKVAAMLETVGTKFQQIRDNISEKVSSMLETVRSKFQQIRDNISEKVAAAKEKVSEAFENIRTSIQEAITAAKEKVSEAFENIRSSIQESMQAAKEKVSEIWESIKSVFSDAMSIGAQIISDIKAGISNAWAGLTSWFSGLWDSLFGNLTANVSVNATATGSAVDGSHASGLNYVPYDGYIAELHKGEMVVPAAEARMIRNGNSDAVANSEVANILTMILDAVQEGNSKETVLKLNNREFGRMVRGAVNA